jgi:KUP system potassium uptake protein
MSSVAAAASPGRAKPKASLPVLLAVLGVVYGDIGTSPLYALKACFNILPGHGIQPWEVLGLLSLIFWSLILIVTVKYVMLVMRADNRGEGGILALMVLAQRVAGSTQLRIWLGWVGIIGASLFFGDGVITPAISVLSAIEGLEIAAPQAEHAVLPLSVAVIIGLFAFQWRGTSRIGAVFGPVMLVWFLVIGVLGLVQLVAHPSVLLALSPTYGAQFIIAHGLLAFMALGAVVLAVTGAEALYADMGHFGAYPIRLSWTFMVLPCLVLNYFGQGALVLGDVHAVANPFFLLVPHVLQIPMVVLATMATVIASQAVITGAYSMARQCTLLGFLPRLVVRHTSTTEEGQIYLPQVNSALALGVLILVLAFKSSDALASAYGIAVTGTFICTCLLAMVAFRGQFRWNIWAIAGVFGTMFVVDVLFFAANSLKIIEGGWVPLAFGLSLIALMTTWKRGRDLLLQKWKQDSLPLASFLARLPQSRTIRVPGIAVFLTGNPDYVPAALLHNLKHNKVLHERVLFVTVITLDVPEAEPGRRCEISELSPGIHRVLMRYGFMESPNIPLALEDLRDTAIAYDPMKASFFLGREMLVPAMVPKMPLWRLWLFLVMARNAVPATEFFRIPSDRVVELGVRVAI